MPTVPVPPAGGLRPLLATWRRGTRIWRCHEAKLAPKEFNPGLGHGRFHPLFDAVTGAPIPTLYGADEVSGTLSETVFRSVPARGPSKRIRTSALRPLCLSSLVLRRDVTLADLSGHGLRRIGVRRAELIESSAAQYNTTARWAEAIHRDSTVDGLLWVARQNDRALGVVLFGDRISPTDLDVLVDSLPLAHGTGWNYVLAAAEECDIAVIM